ncbi:MAG: transposase DNA-binding-containing protein [Crocosphaera sp.]|nr:transposase DNA-binding-containing protein [Crocosphaera sp.]MDJ0730932.1 transposase DNA-binding-containing protein [Crocosphaera sp.]
MKAWVEEELKFLDLGDKRLNTRLGKMISELSEHPYETVPQAIAPSAWNKTKWE